MFYYPTVLRRHSGCFSTIWLVATKAIRVTRRDFLKVNVMRTCDDIMKYILEKVPPPLPDLPKPRFSLYLSTQLQYGVILVYHRQCAILLEELQFIVGRLSKQKKHKIDLDDHSRPALDFPDALALMEEAEGAPDPLFGVMYMPHAMPSPNALIQERLRGTSPDLPEQASLPAAAAAAALESITASPETITLRETEPATIPLTEFEGDDLPYQHPDTLSILLDQSDNFPEEDPEVFRGAQEEQERELERATREGEGITEPTGSIELQPTATLSGDDAMLLPQEEPGPQTDMVTPISAPPLPSPLPAARRDEQSSPELEYVPPAKEEKQKRKRQIIFFDPETQIPQEELKQQINNLQAETKSLSYPPFPSHRRLPAAAELLNTPCNSLPAEVLFLWKQAATITSVSGSDLQVGERGPESTDSERERQEEVLEAAEIKDEQLELSPREIPRDVAEPEMFDISAHGSLPLEDTDQRERSREVSPMYASEREQTPVSRSALQDIPEVPDEALDGATGEPLGLLPELTEHEEGPWLFQSLLPPKPTRQTVSNIFQKLLENLTKRRINVEQSEPYGDIWISPGPNFEAAAIGLSPSPEL